MRSFAWWPVRHRWWVIGGWVALVLVLTGISLAVGGAKYSNNVTLLLYFAPPTASETPASTSTKAAQPAITHHRCRTGHHANDPTQSS